MGSLARILSALIAASLAAASTPAGAVEHHYVGDPGPSLEALDAAAIGKAEHTIDMAAFVLTDVAVIKALGGAARRGVHVRIYLDRSTAEPRGFVAHARAEMAATPNVEVRVKETHTYMHLKAYAIDDTLLRTGSANFSASGLKQQDNELSFDHDPAAIRQFKAMFERMWVR